jgi:hypothetical protein
MSNMTTNDLVLSLAGGALIGLASVLLLWLNGRIAGISGIVNGTFASPKSEYGWRIAFVGWLILGGVAFQVVAGGELINRTDYPVWLTIAAGFFVGFGTRLGSGCTSGHGICGISRLSVRSLVATSLFVATGMLVATLLRGLLV